MVRGKKILLGVCGSIAAYKAAYLIRFLVKDGAEVKVIMTPTAGDFITSLTLATLSKNPVLTSFIKDNDSGTWNNHVELGLWADLMVIAPASANTIAKMAHGQCDNLLLAAYLSARCDVMLAPAMDLDMWKHGITRRNIETLISHGIKIIDPEHGELASGLSGQGRMAEPEEITETISQYFEPQEPLKNKKVLITAGPTHEAIDPVRFIGNHSTGKMGYAVADTIADLGAEVHLVSGPTAISLVNSNIRLYKVTSAEEMHEKCLEIFPEVDIAVLAAAVADYRPAKISSEKIKKVNGEMQMDLIRTHDIAAELSKIKKKDQLTIGFALETENEEKNAREKLSDKNFDLIILNSLKDEGAGFGGDTNKVTILDKHNKIKKFELKSKKEVARDIVNEIITLFN